MPAMPYRVVWLSVLCVAGCGRLHLDEVERDDRPYVQLSIDGAAITEELIEFPLLVRLDTDHVDRSAMLDDGGDLRFYVAGRSAPLPFEIETLAGGPSGTEVVAWVQLPRLAPGVSTVLQVKYGDPAAPRAAGGVWSSSYAAVLHLGELSGAPVDATGRYATVRSATAAPAPGRIGPGQPFVAAAQMAIQLSTGVAEPMPATISGWMNLSSVTAGANTYHALVTQQAENTGANMFFLGLRDTHFYTAFRCLTAEVTPGLELDTSESSQSPTVGQWTHVAATFTRNVDGTNRAALFVEGQLAADTGDAMCEPSTAGSVNPINLGGDVNDCTGGDDCDPDNDWLDGALDEIRIEHVTRSPAWIQTDYLSMTNQLVTYGPLVRADD